MNIFVRFSCFSLFHLVALIYSVLIKWIIAAVRALAFVGHRTLTRDARFNDFNIEHKDMNVFWPFPRSLVSATVAWCREMCSFK